MTPPSVSYPIRAVSRMTGLSIDTLRAWERRYGAVTPIRDGRGRLYTDADVQRLRLLREAVDQGHAIGRVASLDDARLAEVVTTSGASGEQAVVANLQRATPVVPTEAIVDALEHFDGAALESELARAAAMLRAQDLLSDVLMPILTEVGERWHSGRGSIAHEHLLSASVRNVLGSLLRVHQKAGVRSQLVFATPAGERHEFGTLGAAVMAASEGLGAIYLGPDMPADDIVRVTTVSDVDVVALGMTGLGDTERVDAELVGLASSLEPRIELWLGGRGAERAAQGLKGRAVVLSSYDDLERQLARLRARR